MGEGSTRSRGPVRLYLASLVPNCTLTNSYQRFGLLGGGDNPPIGTFSTYCIVSREQVILTPAHLDDVHAAAWPVAGVTAWRYVRPLIVYLCTFMR